MSDRTNAGEERGRRGLVIVYTGGGKGKTTAALGMALRAWGYGWKTLFVQFIKGTWEYGELEAARKLAPSIEIRPMGVGFVHIMGDTTPLEEHMEAAGGALDAAEEEINSGAWDIVVLDEVNVAIHEKLIPVERVMDVVAGRPEPVTIVMTGRYAPDELLEAADLVTEMKEIKHPFQKGMDAQKGIDF